MQVVVFGVLVAAVLVADGPPKFPLKEIGTAVAGAIVGFLTAWLRWRLKK